MSGVTEKEREAVRRLLHERGYPESWINFPHTWMVVDGIVSVRGKTQVDRPLFGVLDDTEGPSPHGWVYRAGVEVDEQGWLEEGEVYLHGPGSG